MSPGCILDESTGLSVCESPSTASLHALLRTVSEYLEHRGLDYEYRLDYLNQYTSGNDVAALSRYVQELQKRAIEVPTMLAPFVPRGPRDAVTSADVELVAEKSAEIISAVQSSFEQIKLQDGHDELIHRVVTLSIVGTVGFGVGFGVAKLIMARLQKGRA